MKDMSWIEMMKKAQADCPKTKKILVKSENCNIKCHQSSEGRFSESDASKGESQSSFFLG